MFGLFGGRRGLYLFWTSEVFAVVVFMVVAWTSSDAIEWVLRKGDFIKASLVALGAPSAALSTIGVNMASIGMVVSLAFIALVGATPLVSRRVAIGAALRVGVVRPVALSIFAYGVNRDANGADTALDSIKESIFSLLDWMQAPSLLKLGLRAVDIQTVLVTWMLVVAVLVAIVLFVAFLRSRKALKAAGLLLVIGLSTWGVYYMLGHLPAPN